MSKIASAGFEIASWEESPIFSGDDGRKVTRAMVTKKYSGDVVGKGSVEFLMAYVGEAKAEYTGMEVFEGTVHGVSGSFIMEHSGTYAEGVVKSNWRILVGSGRGDLASISGQVAFESGQVEPFPMELWYDLD